MEKKQGKRIREFPQGNLRAQKSEQMDAKAGGGRAGDYCAVLSSVRGGGGASYAAEFRKTRQTFRNFAGRTFGLGRILKIREKSL